MKERLREIAKRRIEKLFQLAEEEIDLHPDRSRRYLGLAWKIATTYTIKLGADRRKFCRKCFTLQLPGKTTKVRLEKNKRVVYTCLNCGARRTYGYSTSS
jgi:ribonuclease P protein subunit RPR2